MADKSINQLPVSDGLTDDGLLVVYQNGETKSITGNLIKQFAEQGIEDALADAKESGEFDGTDGTDGTDGVSPIIAVDDITGGHRITITDVNGTQTIDVMDGTDGQDGDDGVSPTIAVQAITGGNRIVITDATGTKTVDVMNGTGAGDMMTSVYDPNGKAQDVFAYVDNAVENAVSTDDIDRAVSEALEEAKASGEFDGVSVTHAWNGTTLTVTSASGTSSANLKGEKGDTGGTGANGISATHSWNGTTLTVTSASGTSSANLKGDKGDKGDTGGTGPAGYTPVRGTDYWTAADKTAMVNDVLAALPAAEGVSV